MPTPVWEWEGNKPSFSPKLADIVMELGHPLVKIINKDVAITRDDGTGEQASVKGTDFISQSFISKSVATSADEGYKILKFLRARDNDKATFIWYNPSITAPPDPTGVTVAGRNYVKLVRWTWKIRRVKQLDFQLTFRVVPAP